MVSPGHLSGRRLIGLTGGIATGKSQAAKYLAAHHRLPVLDADLYARQAVAPGSPVLEKITARYGSQILQTDGTLHRRRLGEIIFSNAEERQWLEVQVHPWVCFALTTAITHLPDPTLVLVVPLLFEAHMEELVSETWVVHCLPCQQLRRLCRRDNLSPPQAEQRIRSQMPLGEKMARADWLLDNSGSQSALETQIDWGLSQTSGRLLPLSMSGLL